MVTTAANPLNAQRLVLGNYPCEGAQSDKVTLDFSAGTDFEVDFSALQSTGHWSGIQTIYIDNSANASNITIVTGGALQTLTVPPNSMFLFPILVTNPPKVSFHSAGGIAIAVHFLNFFLPPLIWSPTAPPGGGGGGGGGATVTVTDNSGNTPVALGANAARKYLLIENPVGSGIVIGISFTGGGNVTLNPGGVFFDNGPNVVGNAVSVVTIGGGANAVTVYEG